MVQQDNRLCLGDHLHASVNCVTGCTSWFRGTRNGNDQEGSDSWDEREKESYEQLLVFSLSQVDGFTSSLIDAACKTPEVTAGWCLGGGALRCLS